MYHSLDYKEPLEEMAESPSRENARDGFGDTKTSVLFCFQMEKRKTIKANFFFFFASTLEKYLLQLSIMSELYKLLKMD